MKSHTGTGSTMIKPLMSESFLSAVRASVERAGVFGSVAVEGGALACAAKASGAPAEFRLFEDGGKVWSALQTADRWLSQSIEADLVHTGDKMEDLIEEELVELGLDHKVVKVEHFRSPEKWYTFRIPVPLERAGAAEGARAALAAAYLLAMEAAYRPLGDMAAGDEDEE